MGLNDYEKQLIRVLEEHPNINTREFIKRSELGKATFYQYSQILEASGFIAYKTVKNQRIWHLIRRDKRHDLGVQDLENSVLEKRYSTIESSNAKSWKDTKR
jgi:predicted transcriptional regulator